MTPRCPCPCRSRRCRVRTAPAAVPCVPVTPWQLPWEKRSALPARPKRRVCRCPGTPWEQTAVGWDGCCPRHCHGAGKGKCQSWHWLGAPTLSPSPSHPIPIPNTRPCPAPVGVLGCDLVDADVQGAVGVAGGTPRLVDAKLSGRHRLARGHLRQVEPELLPVRLRGGGVPVLLDCRAEGSGSPQSQQPPSPSDPTSPQFRDKSR